jgi:hypothetical protein
LVISEKKVQLCSILKSMKLNTQNIKLILLYIIDRAISIKAGV